MVIMFILSFASAATETLGTFRQNQCINLKQAGVGLTSCNITSIMYPNSTQGLGEVVMEKNGIEYNYTYCSTLEVGTYIVTGICTNGTEDVGWAYDFDVTPSGKSGNTNIVFILSLIIFIYGIGIMGFFGRNIPISILGGGAMMGLGVYIINEGLIIYRDWITNYFSYLTIATGAIFSLIAIVEWLEEIF